MSAVFFPGTPWQLSPWQRRDRRTICSFGELSMRTFVLAVLVSLAIVSVATARPAHKKALGDWLGSYLQPRHNDCRTCHVPDKGTEPSDDKPHNAFGARLKEVGRELRKAGKPSDIAARLEAVSEEDTDGDGVTNLLELLAGSNPGEKDDKPADTKVAEAKATVVQFNKTKLGYPWKPFDKVNRPTTPTLKNKDWVRNPIDAFVGAEHERLGLKPRPEASKAVLLRRVYFDLIGLPPTPEELQAFLNDHSADAYEKAVEKLLKSERYGERWGRHWMDVWRYSDWAGWTDGGQIRDSQPHIWRWRDWIVESLNEDKGYDRMLLEMIAADELAPTDEKALRATGYLARNYKMLSREKWMQDTVDHTFMAFQGVTIGCARCHDHMYDPITQKEYYQVRAVFEPHQVRLDRVPGQKDTKLDGLARVYDAAPPPTYLYIRGDDRTPDKTTVIQPGVPESLGGRFSKIEAVTLPKVAYVPDKRPFVVAETLAATETELKQAQTALDAAKQKKDENAVKTAQLNFDITTLNQKVLKAVLSAEELEDTGKKDSEEWKKAATEAGTLQRQLALLQAQRGLQQAEAALAVAQEKQKAAAQMKVTAAQTALKQAEEIARKPATPTFTPRAATTAFPATSTGRRLAFARWLADSENPLTARVAVNHMWMRHFGTPLIPRVFDVGRNGRAPTHPALLDWLASEFMERKWSMKAMHRLIVTSNTYRQASTTDEANVKLDRDNVYLWRMNSRRAEAEVVRDCVFYVAGKLDLTMGGPDIDHKQGMTIARRSLYFRHAAEKQMDFLKLFDAASVTECYQRKDSVQPQQALALANSDLARKHGRIVARTLHTKASTDVAFVTMAFERVLARPATDAEKEECAAFLKEQTTKYQATKPPGSNTDDTQPAADPALRARENLVHVLLNHHDFVTVR